MKYKVREVLTEAQVAFGFLPDDAREGEADTYNVYDGLSNAEFNHAVDVVVNQWITDGLEKDVTVIRAVVGGTGRYAGASGWVKTVHHVDGTWTHEFHLR